MKPLVLGLGNDLLSDDAIGILAARKLAGELRDRAEVVETSVSGVALLDILAHHRQAIIIDAVQTGKVHPGTIWELDPEDLRAVAGPSPHYTGLPEMIVMARQLGLEFPDQIRILAVEAGDVRTIGGPLSAPVAAAVDKLAVMVRAYLERWEAEAVGRVPIPTEGGERNPTAR